MRAALIALMVWTGVAAAQSIVIEPLEPLDPQSDLRGDGGGVSLRSFNQEIVTEKVDVAVSGQGAVLRALDKLTGEVEDVELQNGQSARFGELRIELAECRHPEDNATGEAYAFLSIYEDRKSDAAVFQGWMIASSPALSAMDNARYDVWVIRCKTA